MSDANAAQDMGAADEASREDPLRGYRGRARAKLAELGLRVWSDVRLTNDAGSVFVGVILPRSETFDDLHIVLKQRTGYNVGVHVDRVASAEEIGYKEAVYKIPEQDFPARPGLPKVTLLGTGGTIASRLDYRTGAVIPAFTPGELYGAVPELADHCELTTRKLFGVFSENMGWAEYVTLAEAIVAEIEGGADGVVIGHGTDTMGHTAAVLTFMVTNLPVPVVLVGSQRSSDRPSSDAARNLIHAMVAAGTGPIAEVQICMFGPTSDSYGLLHRGTRCRKMHSSIRSTFRSIGCIPLAKVSKHGVEPLETELTPRDPARKPVLDTRHDDRVTLLYYHPGMKPDMVDAVTDNGYRGLVIAGTGLGHVNRPLFAAIERAIAAGVHVVMTVQTIWGYAQMYVYDTGRDLLQLGVIPLANMLPETALMKLGCVLGRSDDPAEVSRLMQQPVNMEITDREPHDGYMVLQGGLPEVQAWSEQTLK